MNRVTINNERQESYQFKEALKTLRANIQFSGENIKTVSVTSTLPGEENPPCPGPGQKLCGGRKIYSSAGLRHPQIQDAGAVSYRRESGGAV